MTAQLFIRTPGYTSEIWMEESLVDVHGLALVPGPAEIEESLFSFQVYDDLVLHAPDDVAAALLAVPGMQRCNTAEPASGNWAARWQVGERYLDLDFTIMEPEDGQVVWGGSKLRGRCRLSDLLAIWAALRERFKGVWLHDEDCRLYTPEGFTQRGSL